MNPLKTILRAAFVLALSSPVYASDAEFPDAVTIGNGIVTAQISPSQGRIVHFGLAAGGNLLWINAAAEVAIRKGVRTGGWINYGGDKIWPLRQEYWYLVFGSAWPPSPELEGLPWFLTGHDSNRVELRSRPIRQLGIRLSRILEIPPGTRSLVIRNRVERYTDNPFPIQIWSITQIVPPQDMLLDSPGGGVLRHTPRTDISAKTAASGTWCAARYADGTIFLQKMEAPPGANSVEAYSNPDPLYGELETLSEPCFLASGEGLECTVVWNLLASEIPISSVMKKSQKNKEMMNDLPFQAID